MLRYEHNKTKQVFQEYGYLEKYDSVKPRVESFVARLRGRPETSIAVFGHSDFFNCLLSSHFSLEDYWMKNCEVLTVMLKTDT